MRNSRIRLVALILSVVVLGVAGARAGDIEKPKKKAKALKMTLNDLPTAVRATLQAQVAGGQIVEVKQKIKKGQVVFHADVLSNGKDWEIDVLMDGNLLKNRPDKCMDDCNYGPRPSCQEICGAGIKKP